MIRGRAAVRFGWLRRYGRNSIVSGAWWFFQRFKRLEKRGGGTRDWCRQHHRWPSWVGGSSDDSSIIYGKICHKFDFLIGVNWSDLTDTCHRDLCCMARIRFSVTHSTQNQYLTVRFESSCCTKAEWKHRYQVNGKIVWWRLIRIRSWHFLRLSWCPNENE